jgi:DNA repair protein RecN (Recombination protein N)
MLRFLSIRRLAVIDSVEVEFGPGLNVLTGETGAGKSMLVEAVGLLLGGRASGDLVRTGEDTANVEAIFEAANGEELVVRREITSQGRSRAFINGDLATVGALKDLAARLIELHGQHEHQTLLDPSTHLAVLDAFGGLEPLLTPARAAFDSMRVVEAELGRVRRAAAEREARQELVEFQLAELDRAAPKAAEDEELAALRLVLSSAERVERLCEESYATLYERDDAILARLGGVWRRVADLAALDPRFQPYLEARDGIKSQLEDLALFLRRYADGIEASPARLQEVEERLALLERLKRKHGPSLADVIGRQATFHHELSELQHSDARIAELECAHRVAWDAYISAAAALSASRRRAATAFAAGLEEFLGELAMGKARFEVRFADEPLAESGWRSDGFDAAEFFLSPNPGEDPRPLARIVSGGELSRVMLAIKTLTFRARLSVAEGAGSLGAGAPGLIFDEVDAGIGGRVADVVGEKLRALGGAFQVLCITHLPQMAAHADTHFRIDKHVAAGRTQTTITRLDEEGRVAELGRMLGGASVTEALRTSAREMLAERAGSAAGARRRVGAKGETKSKGESESRDDAVDTRKARQRRSS